MQEGHRCHFPTAGDYNWLMVIVTYGTSLTMDIGSGQLTKVAEVVTVVEGAEWLEVVERWVEAVGGDGEGGAGADASCCSSVVRVAFSCCCFFFTSCSADFKSSRVTPGEMVDL